ncbi:hypothetical protein LTR56_000333 [Elasticomyces elasticus]|nr:hypothetical protein LTR56_000333 [Elasticomyces elasticus]KAK3666972.1 hypothetical protein LTR22_002197 [Elasticomyces elasticus]KAK4933325.1 hypothetical protein LTR49_000319 [Elasticomyces elasticus]KAK5757322.1 hypothetical protein LTS12_012534 [Elasticomyces elasticus]
MKACAALGLVALANAAAIDTAPRNRPMSFVNKEVANADIHRPHKTTESYVEGGTTFINVFQEGTTSCTTKHGQTSWTHLHDGQSVSGHYKHGSEVVITSVVTGTFSDGMVGRSAPAPGCCFQINAYSNGGPNGAVDQLSDGQNRVGQTGLTRGKYCIDSNGGLTDSNGRGCILTPPTTQ